MVQAPIGGGATNPLWQAIQAAENPKVAGRSE